MTPHHTTAPPDSPGKDNGRRAKAKGTSVDLEERTSAAPNGCLIWTGAVQSSGYGSVWIGSGTALAHRVSYERSVGPIPEGYQIDHLCRVRLCINPEHLEAVTPIENVHRNGHGLETTCKRDHPLSGPNLLIKKRGAGRPAVRNCRTCRDEQRAARQLAAANVQELAA